MSFVMINAFKRIEALPSERLVAYMLADCCNEKTGRCDPSWATLMDMTSLSRRSIATCIRRLEQAGHLTVQRRPGFRPSYLLHPVTLGPVAAVSEEGTRSPDSTCTGASDASPSCSSCTPPVQAVHLPGAIVAPETEGTGREPEPNQKETSPPSGIEALKASRTPAGADETSKRTRTRPPQKQPQAPAPPDSQGEVEHYARELKLTRDDGRWFWCRFSETGWRKSGGAPVLDWRATMRTWEAGHFFPSQKRSGPSPGSGARTGAGPPVSTPLHYTLDRPRPVMTL